MPKFNVVVQHELEVRECKVRLRGFANQVRETATVELTEVVETWTDDGNVEFAFTAMGLRISGNVQMTEEEIKVNGKLPLAAAFFRGAIETQIAEKIREMVQ